MSLKRSDICFKQVPQTIIKSNENLKVQMYTYVSFLLFLLFWVGGKKNDSNLKSGKIPCIYQIMHDTKITGFLLSIGIG